MNIGGESKRRFSQMLGSAARGVGSVLSSAKSSVLLDVVALDEELWALHGDAEDLDQRCEASIFTAYDAASEHSHKAYDPDGLLRGEEKEVSAPFKQDAEPGSPGEATSIKIKTPDSVIANLPKSFFSADFDPVIGLVNEISAWEAGSVNENFMHRIEECDTDKDLVVERLSRLVESNYPSLMNCLSDVDTISVDMSVALTDIERSRQFLLRGQQKMAAGAMQIGSLQKRLDNLVFVREIATGLQSIKLVLDSISSNFVMGEVGKAAECALRLLNTIRSAQFCQLRALADMETSTIQKQIYTIRQKTDKALMRLSCRKFACADYANIVKSYIILDFLGENFSVELSNTSEQVRANTPAILVDSFGCINGLHSRIHRFQTEDVGTCLRTAVLEFIYAGVQHRHLTNKGAEGKGKGRAQSKLRSMDAGTNMLELEDLPLSQLYTKLEPEMTVPCIVRSCELMADIVHTHYLISQWHSTPFDKRNEDIKHLHRCTVDLDDVLNESMLNDVGEEESSEDDAEARQGGGAEGQQEVPKAKARSQSFSMRSQLHPDKKQGIVDSFLEHFDVELHSPQGPSPDIAERVAGADHGDALLRISEERNRRLRQILGSKMAVTYHSLASCRVLLWDEIVQALLEGLNSLPLSCSIPLDAFLSMNWAIHAMITLGKEFCGSRSEKLLLCLQEKAREYYKHIHGESFHLLKQALEVDSWKSVPVDLQPKGGIVGIVKASIAQKETDAFSSRVQIKELVGMREGLSVLTSQPAGPAPAPAPESVLMFFERHGNPLHFMSDLGLGSFGTEDTDDSGSEEEKGEEDSTGDQFGGDNWDEVAEEEREAEAASDALAAAAAAASAKKADVTGGAKSTFGNFRKAPAPAVQTEADFLTMVFAEGDEDKDGGKRSKRRGSHASSAMVVTRSSVDGLARCMGSYLQMMYLMPSSAPSIFHGLCQLFDFYTCAVFTGFVPPSERSAFLAPPSKMLNPAPDQGKDYEALRKHLERALSEVVSYVKDVEEDGAQSGGHWETSPMSALLQVPLVMQDCDKRSFYGINARIVAAESCWFAAAMWQEILPYISKLLPADYAAACEEYAAHFQLVSSQLRALVYRAMCPLLINSANILEQIAEVGGWDSRKLRAVDMWVRQLVGNSADIWEFMTNSNEFADAAAIVREQVWLELCQCAFDIALDGFSRVKRVSNEGRATMIRDVEAVQAGLEQVHPCRCPRGLLHVEAYLRAAMLAPEEMMLWIQDNHFSYAYRYMHGLAVQTFSSILSFRESRLKDAVDLIDDLYQLGAEEKTKKISGLFGEKEKKSLTSMLKSSVKMGF